MLLPMPVLVPIRWPLQLCLGTRLLLTEEHKALSLVAVQRLGLGLQRLHLAGSCLELLLFLLHLTLLLALAVHPASVVARLLLAAALASTLALEVLLLPPVA